MLAYLCSHPMRQPGMLQSKYRRAVSDEDSEPGNDRMPYGNAAHARSRQVSHTLSAILSNNDRVSLSCTMIFLELA